MRTSELACARSHVEDLEICGQGQSGQHPGEILFVCVGMALARKALGLSCERESVSLQRIHLAPSGLGPLAFRATASWPEPPILTCLGKSRCHGMGQPA